MTDFLSDFLSSLGPIVDTPRPLNTRKINKHILLLKQQHWFKNVYDNKEYYALLFGNRRVRSYLHSSFRVFRMIRNEKVQKKFIMLLNKELKK
ncbi:hypothetical protein BMWSH_3542 [Priestia megaterium WSH-002]|uniref:Uncharacterized protein n=1 Tax=Priestia megaterium (strain WSH-002) TaxID=1006007 RepID=A0A8D3X0S7_PRIMW|nr:hypothetical protein BMWSH_3542 [Priestia megaterium WSH-002]SUV03970.1 group-specific protein [Priestia megaterium]